MANKSGLDTFCHSFFLGKATGSRDAKSHGPLGPLVFRSLYTLESTCTSEIVLMDCRDGHRQFELGPDRRCAVCFWLSKFSTVCALQEPKVLIDHGHVQLDVGHAHGDYAFRQCARCRGIWSGSALSLSNALIGPDCPVRTSADLVDGQSDHGERPPCQCQLLMRYGFQADA